jgi:hypothetical protein
MPALSFDGVLVIALVAVAVPVVLGLAPRLPIPGAVLEVLAGIRPAVSHALPISRGQAAPGRSISRQRRPLQEYRPDSTTEVAQRSPAHSPACRSVSIGLIINPLLRALTEPLRPEQLGDANTLFNTWQRIAGSFGIGLLADLYAAQSRAHGPVPALHLAGPVLAIIAGAGVLGALALPPARPQHRPRAMSRPGPSYRHQGWRRCSATSVAGPVMAWACELRCCRCSLTQSNCG